MVALESDAGIEEAKWLEALPEHAIFAPLQGSIPRRQCIAVRNTDLIVANGKSLRIASLSEVKHQASSPSSSISSPLSSSSYKELTSDVLDFDIVEVILNPTGKLLAVVGSQRVVVVVLPRSGIYSSKTIGRHVAVKAAPVGSFYYHERVGGRARLACVKWHPWGQLGSSLLIMSKDGLLREFDVSSDVQEPAQTVSLLPSSPKSQQSSRSTSFSRRSFSRSRSQTPSMRRSRRSTSRFALDDDDDDNSDETYIEEPFRRYGPSGPAAISFTLGIDRRGEDEADEHECETMVSWISFTILSVCTNGDVYALCPFMPKTAILSLSFLRQLPTLVSSVPNEDVMSAASVSIDLQTRYLSAILKQVKDKRQARQRSMTPSRSRRSISATPMSLDPRASIPPEDDNSIDVFDEPFVIQAPPSTLVPQAPQPQGPFLLHPAPIELSEDEENASADLMYTRITKGRSILDILGIVGNDGRVDLCLLPESIEPRWTNPKTSKPYNNRKRVASSGRYALSDSDTDEEIDTTVNTAALDDLPRLFVYETIDLGIAQIAQSVHLCAPPRFVLDPLYTDTVYVQHSLGAHVLSLRRWSTALLTAMDSPEAIRANAMERALHQTITTDVVQAVDTHTNLSQEADAVIGLCIISDIYLSYSFLCVTQSGAVVALELGLRIEGNHDDESDPAATSPLQLSGGPSLYTSLLGDGPPFAPPEPLKMMNGMLYHARSAIKARQSREELRVSTESLRNLGNIVSTLRGEMRKIVQGGNAVQSRSDLQRSELQRQVKKLSEARDRVNLEQQREDNIEKRIAKAMSRQEALGKRSDWLLQKLVENHSPEISVYEAEWLKELERLEIEIGKRGKEGLGEEEGLKGRVSKLKYQLEMLQPALIEAKEKKVGDYSGQLGASQLQALEALLAREAQLLATDRDMITSLQTKMQRQMLMY